MDENNSSKTMLGIPAIKIRGRTISPGRIVRSTVGIWMMIHAARSSHGGYEFAMEMAVGLLLVDPRLLLNTAR